MQKKNGQFEQNLEQKMEIVRTRRGTYLGYTRDDDLYIYLDKAAVIREEIYSAQDIAFEYFSEKARKQLKKYSIPRTAVEERTHDPFIQKMINTYDEMSKVASRGSFGKFKISRLRKFLKAQGDSK